MAQQVPHTPFSERHKLAGRRWVKSSHAGGVHVATCQRPPCIISRRRHYGMASCWMVPSVLLNVVWWRLLRHRPQTTTSTLLAQVGRTPLRLAIRLSEQRPNACCGLWHLVRVPQSRRWRSRNELPARAPQCLRRCAIRLPCRGMVRAHRGRVLSRNVAFLLLTYMWVNALSQTFAVSPLVVCRDTHWRLLGPGNRSEFPQLGSWMQTYSMHPGPTLTLTSQPTMRCSRCWPSCRHGGTWQARHV